MALSEFELKRCERDLDAFLAKRRPPPHIRPQFDFGYRIKGQSVEICEIRPAWDDPQEIMWRAFAKLTYVKTTETWKLYWMRASGKWHAYDPGEFHQLEHALAVVNQDGYGCFFG
jgi:hypothetical protein